MKKDDPAKPRETEPQSYGSGADWLTGRTGQTVDRTPHKSDRRDEEFYRSSHDDTGTAAEGPARRSPVDDTLEDDPAPHPSAGDQMPRKPV